MRYGNIYDEELFCLMDVLNDIIRIAYIGIKLYEFRDTKNPFKSECENNPNLHIKCKKLSHFHETKALGAAGIGIINSSLVNQ